MLDEFRDVMIIIMAFMAIGTTIMFAVLTFVIFRKISHTLDSVRSLVTEIKGVSSILSNTVVRPTVKGVSFAAGAKRVLDTLSKQARSKEARSGKGE
jgi:hypothetical protein